MKYNNIFSIPVLQKRQTSMLHKFQFSPPFCFRLYSFGEIAGYRRAFAGNIVFRIDDNDKKYYFKLADEALYESKRNGRNRYTFIKPA